MCAENIKPILDAKSKREAVLATLTAVHECGHAYNAERSNRESENGHAYFGISDSITYQCEFQSSTSEAYPKANIQLPLQIIAGDIHSKQRSPCTKGQTIGCDWYASTYLTSDMGEQGLDYLLEEFTQYLHTLETAIALRNLLAPEDKISARDSLLTMMWYLQRYLAVARRDHSEHYKAFAKDPCWSQLILRLWDRAQEQLTIATRDQRLGVDADAIAALVADPLLLKEVQLLRQKIVIGEGKNPTSKTRR